MDKKKPFVYAKTDFGPPPPGYIPGLGRGAVGFITRSDIGEAISGGPGGGGQPAAEPEENYNDNQYDNWNGYGEQNLFKDAEYDEDDKTADQVYDKIEEKMDERRHKRRQLKLQEQLKQIQKEKPTISQQFSDLKRELGTVNRDQWESIPEAIDFSIKKVKKEKYIPVPDSVIDSARKEMQSTNTISVSDGATTPLVNLNDIGQARGTILASQLDKQSDSVEGIKTVDKKGMLTELSSVQVHNEAEIGDFEKVRKIMKSVINSNPKNAEGWIAAARIEELDGKAQNARNILHQGLKYVQDSDNLWLEAARLEPPESRKGLMAQAVQSLPKSYSIWARAATYEQDVVIKKKILKRALEHIPYNPKLWKELIEYEQDEQEAKELLQKAVECVPSNIDMWLALAKLESYDNAKKVLNKARKALPTDHSLWIAAAKLEEAEGKEAKYIEQLIAKGLQILKKNDYVVSRDDWIQEAQFCERSQNPIVCGAVIKAVCFEGLLEINMGKNIVEDMQTLSDNKSIQTCRALYNHAIESKEIKDNKEIFNLALDIEIDYLKTGHEQYLDQLIDKAVNQHSDDEQFWLKCTKDLWKQKSKARSIITRAIKVLPKNENILLLASKLEREDGQAEQAREYLKIAHDQSTTNKRIFKHLLKFELRFGSIEQAYDLAQNAVKLFIKEEKIMVVCAHIYYRFKGIEQGRKIFRQALEYNKDSVILWKEYVEMEMRNKNYAVARPILEKARLRTQKSAEIQRLSVRLEIEADNKKGAIFILSKALKELPLDGELWSYRIELEPKVSRKKIINDALKACDKDPYVYLSGAKLFWKERKFEKVKRWLDLSIKKDSSVADGWAYLYHFENIQGNKEKAQEISYKLENMQLKKGRLWNSVRKSEIGWNLGFKQILDIICQKIEQDLSRIE